EVACLDGHILRQGAAAIRVREAEHPLSHRQPRRAVAESGNHSGQLLPGNNRRPVTAEAIGPGRGPRQLIPGESRRMNLNDDVVYRCLRLGPLHQLHPGRSRSLVRHNDRLHVNCLLGYLSLCWMCPSDKKPVRCQRCMTFNANASTGGNLAASDRMRGSVEASERKIRWAWQLPPT